MILSDKSIKEAVKNNKLVINPFNEENVQPSSYDITLSSKFRVFKNIHKPFIDVKKSEMEEITELVEVDKEEGLTIHPGEFVLASTVEEFKFPDNLVGCLEGRSSLGRIGLIIHSTAGYFDPGFEGTATLEVTNISKMPMRLYPGMRIGQFVFYKMTTPAQYPYGHEKLGSKYQGQTDPTASRLHKDFDKDK